MATTDFSMGVEVGKDYARAGVLPAIRARNAIPRVIGLSVHMKRFEDMSIHDTVFAIAALIRDSIAKARQDSSVALVDSGFRGLGLALPDPVDSTGAITFPTQHPQWRNAHFRDLLFSHLDYDPYIVVDNDANMAAYGEYMLEKQQSQIRHMAYVVTGAGIGAGIIIDSAVYSGCHGFAGEFGHSVVDPQSNLHCLACRQDGCLDVLGSGTAIARSFTNLGGKAESLRSHQQDQSDPIDLARNGHFLSHDGHVVYATGVLQAAAHGTAEAVKAIEQAAQYLGIGLVGLYHTLDPELMILGGITNLSPRYYDTAVKYVHDHVHPAIQGSHPIKVSRLGADAPLVGAALRAEELWMV